MTGHGPDLVIGAALLLVGIADLIVAVKNAVNGRAAVVPAQLCTQPRSRVAANRPTR